MTLTGISGLNFGGLIYAPTSMIFVSTWRTFIDGVSTVGKVFVYNPYYDDNYYLRKLPDGNLTPIAERAIVEYILIEKHCDEGLLIEALKSYIENGDANYPLLYEVADHFKLSREVLDYWIKEAKEDCEV